MGGGIEGNRGNGAVSMTERHPESLRWIKGQGEEGSSAPGRCEVSPAGKSDIELLDAYSRAETAWRRSGRVRGSS
jgi:hypothetical protein